MTFRILGPDDPALIALNDILNEHPSWETRLVILPWAEYQAALDSALASAVSPYQAVCIPGHIWLPGLVDKGQLAAFEPLLARVPEEIQSAYDAGDLVPAVAAETRCDGKTYLLPVFTDGHLLFFNKRMVELEDGAVVSPMKLDSLASRSKPPAGGHVLALKAHPSEIFLDWLPYLWEAGGEIINGDGEPGFSGTAGVQALEYYISLKRWCPPQPESYGNAEIAAALSEGRISMAASWGGQAAAIYSGKVKMGAAVFPKPWNTTWGISLPSNQPAPVLGSTLERLFAICGPELDSGVIRVAGSPVRCSSYSMENCARYPWLGTQIKMLRSASRLPADPRLGLFLGDLYTAVYEAFIGHLPPRQALEGAARKATASLDA
jgi:multiple sugar transport system substrate-binding protein